MIRGVPQLRVWWPHPLYQRDRHLGKGAHSSSGLSPGEPGVYNQLPQVSPDSHPTNRVAGSYDELHHNGNLMEGREKVRKSGEGEEGKG